ncbi:MAG: NADH-quinone oxidoreductase subunit C [Dehalococcoidia bacterium]
MTEKGQQDKEQREPDPQAKQLMTLLQEALSDQNPQITYNLDEVEVVVEPGLVREVCRIAREDERLGFDYLRCLAVVEYDDCFQAVYHLFSTGQGHRVVFKASAPKDNPVFASVTPVWRGADWHEREGAELFGVTFEGHPNPEHLLLWDGFEGYPGRKEYPFAEIVIPDDIEVPK